MQVFQVPQYMNMVGIDTGTTTNIIHLEEEEPAVLAVKMAVITLRTVYTFSTTTTTARAATTLYTSIKSNTKTNRYLNASASANIHQNLQQQHRHHNQRRQLLGFHGGAATLGGALHGGLGSEGMMVARRPVCSISGSPRAGPPLEMVRARVDTKKSCCNPLVCMFETSFVVQFP